MGVKSVNALWRQYQSGSLFHLLMHYTYQYSIQKTTVELNSNLALSILCVFSIYLKINMNWTKQTETESIYCYKMPDLIKDREQIFTTSTCSHNKFLQKY